MRESAQIALSDNTMATDKNRQRIVSAGGTHSTRRAVEVISNLSVGHGITGFNLGNLLPNLTAKFRAVLTGLPIVQSLYTASQIRLQGLNRLMFGKTSEILFDSFFRQLASDKLITFKCQKDRTERSIQTSLITFDCHEHSPSPSSTSPSAAGTSRLPAVRSWFRLRRRPVF